MKRNVADRILLETEEGYDMVADKFSQTRKNFWADLEFIKDYAKGGDKVLDYGCGNGRLLELLGRNINYVGADASQKLIDKAKNKYQAGNIGFQKIDPGQEILPFSDNYFNTVYSVATFHHLPGEDRRNMIAKELYRITKPEGYAVVTVWNLWQEGYLKKIFENWGRKAIGKSKLDWNDCYIAFADNNGNVFNRYHHAFTRTGLQKLFSKAGFEVRKCEIINNRNIILIAEK